MKKISIIMPVFNSKKFLKESLNSIIEQTYDNWELIAINDFGSDDGSLEILNYYADHDERIRVIQNTKRLGISESMNLGIKKATGDYIARMDADDISLPERFKVQVEFLESNPEIGMCGIQPTYFGTSELNWTVETDPGFIKHAVFFYSPCVHPTIMCRKELLMDNNILYNKNYKASEDFDLFARFSLVGNITNINDPSLFKYRLHSSNATNTQNTTGLINYSKTMKAMFKKALNLTFTDEEIDLLNVHVGFKKYKERALLKKYIEFDLLLKRILVAANNSNNYDRDVMFQVLKKRFNEARWSMTLKNKGTYAELIDFYTSMSIFSRDSLQPEGMSKLSSKPTVSVILPVYNGQDYIIDSISSVLNQSFSDFELLVIYETATKDETLKYINIFDDKRIKVLKTSEKLGLAKSLNYGIENAKGKYIARLDADDLADRERFAKQVEFMDNNESVDVCGTWQKHFGVNYMWIHKTPYEDSKIKALLLFECCLCHSTLMLRTKTLKSKNYRYRTDIRQEDFELWTRMADDCKFAVLQEILGYYRLHENNITGNDLNSVSESQCKIISRNLEKLHIGPDKYNKQLLIGFMYLYDTYPELKKEALTLFKLIKKQNEKYKVYEEEALNEALDKRLKWINKEDRDDREYIKPKNENGIIYLTKKVFDPFYSIFKRRIIKIVNERINENNDYLWHVFGEFTNEINKIKVKANNQQRNEKKMNIVLIKEIEELRDKINSLESEIKFLKNGKNKK